jgi:DNA repair protein RecN (Recombination protein N)
MLAHLRITDYAIIESVELALAPGLNAITGETGAGKSIIVGAAGLLRGGRSSADVVRKGSKEAVIEGVFDLSSQHEVRQLLTELGLPDDGEELLVRRVVSRAGRSRIYVNGAICTASMLARLASRLFDISGQHEYQSLSDRAVQRSIVDAVGVEQRDLERMREVHRELRGCSDALQRTEIDDRHRAERLDFLRFQLEELQAAQLRPGEEHEIEQQRGRLLRATDLRAAAEASVAQLYDDSGAVSEVVAMLARRLGELQTVDSRLEEFVRQLDEARVLVEDAAVGLRRYAEGVEVDPVQLEQVEQRFELIQRLKRKHGNTLDDVLAHLQQMQQEYDELESLETRRAELAAELERVRARAERCANKLSRARVRAAKRLSEQISHKLAALKMNGARVTFRIEAASVRDDDLSAFIFPGADAARRVGPQGWDRVDLVAALNPGEDPRPIGRVASGGELSRLMLALRQVLGEHDPVATSVFDEVDAGISGAVADVVGRSLADVARHRQVLVVTHLPQVAAYAQRHFHVGKAARTEGRTSTSVSELDPADQIEELARMLAASEVTDQARASAEELLRLAGRARA